jgi:hypothetical protein
VIADSNARSTHPRQNPFPAAAFAPLAERMAATARTALASAVRAAEPERDVPDWISACTISVPPERARQIVEALEAAMGGRDGQGWMERSFAVSARDHRGRFGAMTARLDLRREDDGRTSLGFVMTARRAGDPLLPLRMTVERSRRPLKAVTIQVLDTSTGTMGAHDA